MGYPFYARSGCAPWIWAWQPAKLVLVKAVGRAGPVWRHAFVRFTENRVIRTFFLSSIRLEHEREGTWSQIFSAASCPRLQAPGSQRWVSRFNPIGLHRRVKTDLSGRKAGAIGSNLMHLACGLLALAKA